MGTVIYANYMTDEGNQKTTDEYVAALWRCNKLIRY